MSNLVRILVVIACIVAFYYLVVTLARSVREEDLGLLDSDPVSELARGGSRVRDDAKTRATRGWATLLKAAAG